MENPAGPAETPLECYKRAMKHLREKDWSGAIAEFDRAIQLDARYVAAYVNRGAARNASGDAQGALADWELALQINPSQPSIREVMRIVKKRLKGSTAEPAAGRSSKSKAAAAAASGDVPLVRTDFEDESGWTTLCSTLTDGRQEFRAAVTPLSDRRFAGVSPRAVGRLLPEHSHSFILIADRHTLTDRRLPILVVDLAGEPGRSFRVTPAVLWQVENNLSTGNMAFEEFEQALDGEGMFEGFDQ
jgi:tetratricopeptide (TPR) repeat protein